MVRGVREANSLRIQERTVMESLLPANAGPQCNKGTASPPPTERQAGKALTHAISQPSLLLLTSMRNRQRNHATTCLAFFRKGNEAFRPRRAVARMQGAAETHISGADAGRGRKWI